MIGLAVLDLRVDVLVGGERAAELERAIRTAWAWCVDDRERVADLVVETELVGLAAPTLSIDAVRSHDLTQLMQQLTSVITERAISAQAGRLFMIHACGLADPVTGAVVALVGRSGAGKTTIAAALGGRLAYVSDETVAIRPDGSVIPFPKPLSVVRAAGDARKDQRSPAELGLRRCPPLLRLSAIVLLDRDPAAALVPVSADVGLLPAIVAIASELSYFAELARPLQRAREIVELCGGVRRLSYREAASTATILGDLIGARPWR